MVCRSTVARVVNRATNQVTGSGGGAAGGYVVSDSDAATYITAVETADGATLEDGIKQAIDEFVAGCKTDSIWTAIKASCILAGARTLSGALVPLAGSAPTNVNFVSGDYSRTAGLTGNASTKRLTANRATADDPQDNCHLSLYMTTNPGGAARPIGSFTTSPSFVGSFMAENGTAFMRSASSASAAVASQSGFNGASRDNSANVNIRNGGTTANRTLASLAPSANPSHFVFATSFNGSGAINYSGATIAFYSIGEALDLALLDSRVSTLITAIGAALA